MVPIEAGTVVPGNDPVNVYVPLYVAPQLDTVID
jgi:hypothetical protein